MTARRRLILMRHAKAETFAETDRERVLTERGRRDAVAAGMHLVSIGVLPGYVLVSSATRAVGTWEAVAHGAGADPEVSLDDAIYGGGPEVVTEVLRAVALDAEVVMVIGHNPTVAYLAHLLDDGNGDEAALREMALGYPTSALTVFEVEVPWSDLGADTATVTHFHVGRG